MASGCIVGDCPICGDLIWEDEWEMVVNTMIHDRCKKQYIKSTYHMSEEQFQRFIGVSELRKNIEEAKKTEEERHKWSLNHISKLEKDLLDIRIYVNDTNIGKMEERDEVNHERNEVWYEPSGN